MNLEDLQDEFSMLLDEDTVTQERLFLVYQHIPQLFKIAKIAKRFPKNIYRVHPNHIQDLKYAIWELERDQPSDIRFD